ncbi:hypothetical protein ACS2BQ_27730 [Bacillus cereus group sp. BceL306]|uniref:hypothetical protein n=1 Tax=unclassified Bacillus cereus group TaxID=2750818 RepID=UPI003F28F643
MITGNSFENEYYRCRKCRTFHSRKELEKMREERNYPDGRWKCLDCGSDFWVYAKFKGKFPNMIFERKLVKDLEKGNKVVFTIDDFKVHEVMDEPKNTNGKVYISFSNYRSTTENAEDWVNCFVGEWDGDTSRFK